MSSIAIVAYLALFIAVGFGFLFVNLLVGRFLRPDLPNPEKLEVYECGEPTIGSSFVQFDLRFYVVALLFIIFDVEIAFFFPWATVFGKSTHLMDPHFEKVVVTQGDSPQEVLTDDAVAKFQELGVADPRRHVAADAAAIESGASQLAWLSFFDILVFFGVLMVGFFYVWKRGDLDWVRAVSAKYGKQASRPPPGETVRSGDTSPPREPVFTG
jgi:NADH-quinone oxidoreductase subunit A